MNKFFTGFLGFVLGVIYFIAFGMSVGNVPLYMSTSLYILPAMAELYFVLFAGGYFLANVSDIYNGTNTKEKAVMQRELGKSAFDTKRNMVKKSSGFSNLCRFCFCGKA